MKRYAAFFDLDRTILNTSSGKLFVRYLYQKKRIGRKDLFKGICIGLANRVGLLDTQDIIAKWAMRYKGISEKRMVEFSKRWFDEVVVNYFRESIVEEINVHKIDMGRVVILSASSRHVCEIVKEYLKLDDVICTEIEVIDGIFTGKLLGKYCHGKEKLSRALEYCRSNKLKIEDAFYYADSIADLYVLERVGNPVCVSPDKRLRNIAMDRGWKIIED